MRLTIVDAERCIGCQLCMFACGRRKDEPGLSEACINVRSVGGMERGFIVIVCKACEDPPCAKVCPTKALKPRASGGVKLDITTCIGCRNCKDNCMIGAISWDEEINKPMICIHCGYCVQFCPHGILKLEKKKAIKNATK